MRLVLPFARAGHSAPRGACTILRFAYLDAPDVVYIEHVTSSLYLDKADDVDCYSAAMSHLFIEAEPPEGTLRTQHHS